MPIKVFFYNRDVHMFHYRAVRGGICWTLINYTFQNITTQILAKIMHINAYVINLIGIIWALWWCVQNIPYPSPCYIWLLVSPNLIPRWLDCYVYILYWWRANYGLWWMGLYWGLCVLGLVFCQNTRGLSPYRGIIRGPLNPPQAHTAHTLSIISLALSCYHHLKSKFFYNSLHIVCTVPLLSLVF